LTRQRYTPGFQIGKYLFGYSGRVLSTTSTSATANSTLLISAEQVAIGEAMGTASYELTKTKQGLVVVKETTLSVGHYL
jgi:hypothetical protein